MILHKRWSILLLALLVLLMACATIPPAFRGMMIPGLRVMPTATNTPVAPKMTPQTTPYIFITPPPMQTRPTRTPVSG